MIEREGPTGLITTTTALRLHPENETRMVSLTVTDSAEQTRAIFDALADDGADESDLGQWQALQTWLAAGPCKVVVPFAKVLAALVPPLAVRLRRDFRMVLTLVGAHALLHQASRLKDDKGRVIATIREDYATVRSLVADLVATGVEASVSKAVRETVRATADIIEEHGNSYEVNQSDLADRLRLDKGAVSRRVGECCQLGYLRNNEERKPGRRRPARLVLGDKLPEEQVILPDPALVDRLFGCGRDTQPPPPSPKASGAGPATCVQCGQVGDENEPLVAHDAAGERVRVHGACFRFWNKAGRPATRSAATGAPS